MTRPSPEQTNLIQRALTVQPIGEVPDAIRAYAARWFGPTCVRVEVTGHSASEYDDELTTEYGTIRAVGYDVQGQALGELFEENGDGERSYWEALAQFEEDLARGLVSEDERPGALEEVDERWLGEAQVTDLAALPEHVRFYWGPPGQDPYMRERALLAKLAEI